MPKDVLDIDLDRIPDDERPLVLAMLRACYQRKGPQAAQSPNPTPGAPGLSLVKAS